MKEKPVFQKYERARNVRSNGPSIRVNKGYFFFNRVLVTHLGCERVDLYVDPEAKTVLVRPGKDFKLTFTAYGRATFSAAPFINELGIPEGFYPADPHGDGMIFTYRD